MIDTHAHLNFPDYRKDIAQVISRSVKKNVNKIICVSSNVHDSKKSVIIAKQYDKTVWAAIGIHPHKTNINKGNISKQIEIIKKLASTKEVCAIGECDLDFSPAPPGEKNRSVQEQILLFKSQIEIALQYKKPLIIHTRQAFKETVAILKKFKNLTGVFHCYSAGKKGIQEVVSLGFYFGIDGNLTYDQGLQNVAEIMPLDRILLETDCPFLSPVPKRNKRNEPAFMKYTAQKLAKIKNLSLEIINKTTVKNTEKLFSI